MWGDLITGVAEAAEVIPDCFPGQEWKILREQSGFVKTGRFVNGEVVVKEAKVDDNSTDFGKSATIYSLRAGILHYLLSLSSYPE